MKINPKYKVDSVNNDAAQGLFLTRELSEIDERLFDVKYAALESLELVQPKMLDPGTEEYIYQMFDKRGVAQMSSDYASGSPRVDVSGTETSAKVRSVRASFGYSFQEIRAAAKAGRPLEQMKAVAARRAVNEKINTVALLGDTLHGLEGLFSLSNAQTYTVPADGTGASKLWSTKTATLILRDMFGIVDQIPTSTKEVENAKRLLLPYARLRTISSMKLDASYSDKTVLEFFKIQRPQIEVRGALLLDTAGSGGVARMVAYDPNPENLELLLPVPFETFPPQLDGMEYVVECHARVGSVVARYPMTIAYGDGI